MGKGRVIRCGRIGEYWLESSLRRNDDRTQASCTFEESDLKAIKVRITGSRAEVHLSRVGVFHAPAIADKATGADWNDIPREEWTVDNDHPLVLNLGRKAALTAFTYAPLESRGGEEMAFRFSFRQVMMATSGTQS